MLAVSHLGNNHDDHQYHIIHQQRQEEEEEEKTMMMMERVADSAGGGGGLPHDLRDFCNSNSSSLLLDSIDFEDLFLGIHEGDVLPDLEMDPELLADFSLTSNNDESSDTLINTSTVDNKSCTGDGTSSDYSSRKKKEGGGDNNFDQSSCRRRRTGAEEVVSKMSKVAANVVVVGKAGKKTTTTGQPSKNNAQVKRKVKVDWTAELHRRFVQAVEQLGVDKAVPSRILELMGIHCLTRHNIASHLQKYRSHRKHLLAREAEAACWSQRRQIYGAVPVVAPAAAAATVGGGNNKSMSRSDVISPCWVPPATLGLFPPPPVTAAAPVPPIPHFRPLHVWGHPTITDQSQANIWQKHHPPPHPPSTHPPAAASAWPPPLHHHFQPQTPPPYWPHQHQPVPNVAGAGGTPCFTPPPLILPPPTAVPGIPPPPHHAMYKLVKAASSLIGPRPLDLLPSKESIDAAIGDVLWKPWLPMPLGLKPPSVDGVMGELHRQGLPNIPLNPTTFPLPSFSLV